MIIAVFSLGQFISSKLDVLKSGFQEWFAAQKKEVSGEDVWKWMASNLGPLRVGAKTLQQFCDEFNQQFKVEMTFADFRQIFNSMSKLDADSLLRVSRFQKFLAEHETIKFVLVSHTNYSHLYYILDQLEGIIPNSHTAIISDDREWTKEAQIMFAPSMSSKCTEHPDTLKYALKKLQLDANDHVVSFLNTIKVSDLEHFSYLDPGKDLENVTKTLEDLLPINALTLRT